MKDRSNSNSKLKKLNNILSSRLARSSGLIKAIGYIWIASKNLFIIWLTLLIIQGLLPGITVYLTKVVVNILVAASKFGASWQTVEYILPAGLAMGAVLLSTELIQNGLNWIRVVQSELVQDHINSLINEKAISLDLSFYESAQYYDKLDRARTDASSQSISLLENTGSLLQNSITLLAMIALLIPYGIWLPVALIASMLPALLVVLRSNRAYYNWWQSSTTQRRRSQYYQWLITLKECAPELRLFDFGSHYLSLYNSIRQELREERWRLIRNQNIAKLFATASGLIVAAASLSWMVWQLLLKSITLGDLALFYQTFNKVQSVIGVLLRNAGQVYSSSLFVDNLSEFLLTEPSIIEPVDSINLPKRVEQGIEFKQVTFRYKSGNRDIFKDFNLSIPANKIIAIVGDNGAGKSTFLKLLCRFYDPQEGSIEIDGIDIRKIPSRDWQRAIAVLFQFPVRYEETVSQNIMLGDLAKRGSLEDVKLAAQASGITETINRLERGYDHLLGQLFPNGTDLSGGEWQRIALARAFYREAPIIILDEPTSAMDSWAEADWLDRFRVLVEGKTGVVITHRFTLAMRADLIYVMREGQIVESGTHSQLLQLGGLYAQSWQRQTEGDSFDFPEISPTSL